MPVNIIINTHDKEPQRTIKWVWLPASWLIHADGKEGSRMLMNCRFETSLTFGDKSWMRQWLVIRSHFYFLLQLTMSLRHAGLSQRQGEGGLRPQEAMMAEYRERMDKCSPAPPLLEQSSAKLSTYSPFNPTTTLLGMPPIGVNLIFSQNPTIAYSCCFCNITLDTMQIVPQCSVSAWEDSLLK